VCNLAHQKVPGPLSPGRWAWNFLVERCWLFFESVRRLIGVILTMNCVRRVHTHRLLTIQKTSFDNRLPGDPPGERVAWKFAVERLLLLFNFVFFRCIVRGCGKPGVQPNRSTKKFQAPFRQVGGLELAGRTTLTFWSLCVVLYTFCTHIHIYIYITCTCGGMYMVSPPCLDLVAAPNPSTGVGRQRG
jgi:hypothetical protein